MPTPDPSTASPPDTSAKRPAPRGSAAYPRKRAVTACQVCRARRTKCDNLKPSCSFCVKTGATCIQSAVDLSSFDPASLKILERLDDVETLVKFVSNNVSHLTANDKVLGFGEEQESAEVTRTFNILPQRVEDVFLWPILRDSSDGVGYESHESHPMRLDFATVAQSPVSAITLLYDEPQKINAIVENFFNYVNVKNPILSERSSRQLVSTTVIEGLDWSPSSCLSLIICALGAISTPFGPSESTLPGSVAYANAEAFYAAAEKRIGILVASEDLIGAQCFFLCGVYMMCTLRPKMAWKFFLQALAACQDFPFLLDPLLFETSEDSSALQDEGSLRILQEAIYWSTWKSEREMRSDLHVPDFAFSDEDKGFYPTFFPTPPLPQYSNHGMDTRAMREAKSWYFYLSEISLKRLSSRICREILDLRQRHASPTNLLSSLATAVPSLKAEVEEWVNSLPPLLSFNAPLEEDDICRFVLRGHVINVLELLYWPFVLAIVNRPNAYNAKATLDAQLIQFAEEGIHTHVKRIRVNSLGFRHRHHGTLPMIRSCTRSALVLVASALTLKKNDVLPSILEMPSDWREQVQAVLDLLRYWEPECPDLHTHRAILERSFDSDRGG